jgi:hypothetical protein
MSRAMDENDRAATARWSSGIACLPRLWKIELQYSLEQLASASRRRFNSTRIFSIASCAPDQAGYDGYYERLAGSAPTI